MGLDMGGGLGYNAGCSLGVAVSSLLGRPEKNPSNLIRNAGVRRTCVGKRRRQIVTHPFFHRFPRFFVNRSDFFGV